MSKARARGPHSGPKNGLKTGPRQPMMTAVLVAGALGATLGCATAAPPQRTRPARAVQAAAQAPSPSAPATAQTGGELRQGVERLLSGYEPGDPGEALRRLGAPAAEVLLQIAQDGKAPPLRRLRAIEALQHVPTSAGREYLGRLVAERRAATEPLGVYELAAAARALGGFGAPAAPELIPLLDHDSADVREGAAYALGLLRTAPALAALQRRLRIESESGVREALSRALRR